MARPLYGGPPPSGQGAPGSFGYSPQFGGEMGAAPSPYAPAPAGAPAAGAAPGAGPAGARPAAQQNLSPFDTNPFSNAPMANMGLKVGRDFVAGTAEKYMPAWGVFWRSLKYYFHIDNSYVRNKLSIVMMPFRHSDWNRLRLEEGSPPPSTEYDTKFQPPVHDVNAPDMYVPLMSFVTLVLVTGVLSGQSLKFTPETLSDASSFLLVCLFLETVVYKLGLYLLDLGSASTLDLVAYASYKCAGMVLIQLVGLLGLGTMAQMVVLVYTGGCMVWFMRQTLNAVLAPSHGARAAVRNYFCWAAGALQFMVMWWVGFSG